MIPHLFHIIQGGTLPPASRGGTSTRHTYDDIQDDSPTTDTTSVSALVIAATTSQTTPSAVATPTAGAMIYLADRFPERVPRCICS